MLNLRFSTLSNELQIILTNQMASEYLTRWYLFEESSYWTQGLGESVCVLARKSRMFPSSSKFWSSHVHFQTWCLHTIAWGRSPVLTQLCRHQRHKNKSFLQSTSRLPKTCNQALCQISGIPPLNHQLVKHIPVSSCQTDVLFTQEHQQLRQRKNKNKNRIVRTERISCCKPAENKN